MIKIGTIFFIFLTIGKSFSWIYKHDPYQYLDTMRNYFATELASDYTCDDINKIIFYPTKELLTPPDKFDFLLQKKEKQIRNIKVQDLYQEGVKRGFKIGYDSEMTLDPNHPITFIFFPGIMGEFIEASPHEELIQADSTFKKEWLNLLEKTPDNKKYDKCYDLQELKEIDLHFNELYKVGSIDDILGRPLVRYIYLRAPFASLETLGTLKSKNELYSRRLAKLFDLIGIPNRIYFVGYSLGANVGLELLNHVDKNKNDYPWFKNLKGFLSYAGVLFGTDASNAVLDEKESLYKTFKELRKLTRNLEDYDEVPTHIPGIVARNTSRWIKVIGKIDQFISTPDDFNENIKTNPIKLSGAYRFVMKIIRDTFELHYSASYFKNIRRFKILVERFYEAVVGLTSVDRSLWWKDHTIPTGINYFSFSATMPDKYDESNPSLLLKGPFYGDKSFDYNILRSSYYSIYDRTGVELNDSQVGIFQTFFWPNVHMALNNRQKFYRHYYLGVLGTHHWGISFPYAFESRPDVSNPYPRTTLLKAFALTINHIEKD